MSGVGRVDVVAAVVRACAALVLALCSGGLPAQTLRVATDAERAAVEEVGRLEEFASLDLEWVDADEADGGEPVDVWFLIDLGRAQRLARDGRLAALEGVEGATDRRWARADDGTWSAAWASTWVLAGRRSEVRAHPLPESWDGLRAPQYDEHVVFPPFADAPDLYVGWILQQIAQRGSEDAAFAWLRTLDARAADLIADPEAARRRLLDDASVHVAVLPVEAVSDRRDLAHAADGRPGGEDGGGRPAAPGPVYWRAPTGDDTVLPARLLCHAVPTGEDAESGRQLLAGLLGAEASAVLAAWGYLPVTGFADGTITGAQRDLRDRLAVRPAAAEGRIAGWLARYEDSVRGAGDHIETVDTVVDVLFGVLFVVLLIVVARRLGRSGG